MTALIEKAGRGAAGFFLQFGGQGARWLGELGRLYEDPLLKDYMDCCFDALDQEVQKTGDHPLLSHSLEPLKWLKDPAGAPSEDYLEIASVSIVMIQITQLAHYERLRKSGYTSELLSRFVRSASGHSQGLVSTCFAAMCLDGSEYYDMLSRFTKYAFHLGLSCQSVYPYPFPSIEEISQSKKTDEPFPSPMAAFVGGSHEFIEDLVSMFNKGKNPEDRVYVSLYNSPSNRIVSAKRESHIAFHEFAKDMLLEKEIKFIYLQASCPFHSPLMPGVDAALDRVLDEINFRISGNSLKYPVYSFFDKKDLREVDDLGIRLGQDMSVNTLYWEKSLAPAMADQNVTHILDFGPGKTSKRLTSEIFEKEGREIEILSAALPKDFKALIQ